MDDRLRRRVFVMARELAAAEKNRLDQAVTLVEIEDLAVEIGDELMKQLAQTMLTERADAAAATAEHAWPECERKAPPDAEREPLILQGTRGEIEYSEPACYCTRCRVRFFPSGRPIATPDA